MASNINPAFWGPLPDIPKDQLFKSPDLEAKKRVAYELYGPDDEQHRPVCTGNVQMERAADAIAQSALSHPTNPDLLNFLAHAISTTPSDDDYAAVITQKQVEDSRPAKFKFVEVFFEAVRGFGEMETRSFVDYMRRIVDSYTALLYEAQGEVEAYVLDKKSNEEFWFQENCVSDARRGGYGCDKKSYAGRDGLRKADDWEQCSDSEEELLMQMKKAPGAGGHHGAEDDQDMKG